MLLATVGKTNCSPSTRNAALCLCVDGFIERHAAGRSAGRHGRAQDPAADRPFRDHHRCVGQPERIGPSMKASSCCSWPGTEATLPSIPAASGKPDQVKLRFWKSSKPQRRRKTRAAGSRQAFQKTSAAENAQFLPGQCCRSDSKEYVDNISKLKDVRMTDIVKGIAESVKNAATLPEMYLLVRF